MNNINKNCIIDARVSTDKQLNGKGLEDQRAICESHARKNNWTVVCCFSKSYSGRKEERTDFEEILNFIKKSKIQGVVIDYYLVKSIDRLTRNGHATYELMKQKINELGVQLVDTYGIMQEEKNTLEHLGVAYDWSKIHPSEITEVLVAQQSKNEVNQILTRMIGAEISLAREGFSVRRANDGYLNKREIYNERERVVLTQDPQRSFFFKEMFKLRISGLSDQKIVKHINSLGYESKPHKKWSKENSVRKVIGFSKPKKLTVKTLQKIITRPIYAGIKTEKWLEKPEFAKFSQSSGPIVSVEEFNRANRGKVFIKILPENKIEILKNYSERATAKRLKYHPEYKYDKMVMCHVCGKPYKNSGIGNKGKSGKTFKAYHCDREISGKKHYQRIPREEFESNVTNFLNHIKFKDEFLIKLEEKLIKKFRSKEKDILGKSITIADHVTELKIKQDALLTQILQFNSPLVIKRIEKEIEILENEIAQATESRDKIEIKERDIKSFIRYAKDLMEHPIKILGNNSDPYKQKLLFDLIFESGPSYVDIVNGTPKLSFIFKLSEEFKADKSALVTLLEIEPCGSLPCKVIKSIFN